jgi:TonB family protein
VQITAAHAVKKMPVQLPPDVKALLQREESVSVRVTVDRTGKVVNAAPEGADGALRQMLAHFAVGAVQHWTFEPARREGEAINSTVTLTFRFGPGATNR